MAEQGSSKANVSGPPLLVKQKLALKARRKGNCTRFPSIMFDPNAPTLQELLVYMGDEFPNNGECESFRYPSNLDRIDIEEIRDSYAFPDCIEVLVPSPEDRTCNWHPERLYVYREALEGGLRFPIHPFVVRLLAEAKVNTCQLYPNAWRYIYLFMVRCSLLKIPLSIPLFRSLFVFKNSPATRKGWVAIQHRTKSPPICDPCSLPEKLHDWQYHFCILEWKDGDWGEYFRSSFNWIIDPGKFALDLRSQEFDHWEALTTGAGSTHYRHFLNERNLVEVGLSPLSLEGKFIVALLVYDIVILIPTFCLVFFQLRRRWTLAPVCERP